MNEFLNLGWHVFNFRPFVVYDLGMGAWVVYSPFDADRWGTAECLGRKKRCPPKKKNMPLAVMIHPPAAAVLQSHEIHPVD